MRVLKFIGYGALAVGAILVIAVISIAVLFDPNAHKAQLQHLVKTQTGRDLSLPGALKLSVFPWLAVELGPASLGNAAGFSAEPMVAFAHARLGVKLFPLLHGRLEVSGVQLESPAIVLEVDSKGRNNWSDMGHSHAEAPAAATTPTAGRATAISIAGLQMTNGQIQYVNSATNTRVTLRDLTIKTGAITTGQPFDASVGFTLQRDPASTMRLLATARADLDANTGRYRFTDPDFEMTLTGGRFPRAGLPIQLRAGAIDADLTAQTLKVDKLELDLAGAHLTGTLQGEKIVDGPQISGQVQLANMSPRELLPKLGIALPAMRDPSALQRLEFSASLVATSNSAALSGLRLKLDDTTVSGSAGVTDLKTEALVFDLKLDRLDADRYRAPAVATPRGPAAPTGPKVKSAVAIPVDLLRTLNLRGELGASDITLSGLKYSLVRLGINAQGGTLHLYPSEARLYGGQYRGDITLDAAQSTPRVTADEQLTGVDFAPLLKDLMNSTRFSGRGNLSFKITAMGLGTDALLHTLNGPISVAVKDGALEGADLWYEISRARAVLNGQAIPPRTGPPHTAFTALAASGHIDNGILSNNDLNIATHFLQIKGQGMINIPAETLDYELEAAVPNGAVDGASGAGLTDLGGLTVPVRITGALASPTVRPDLQKILKAKVQQELNQKKGQVKQQVQKKLQDQLKGLFGH